MENTYIENRGYSFVGNSGLTQRQLKEIIENYREQAIDRRLKKYIKYIL